MMLVGGLRHVTGVWVSGLSLEVKTTEAMKKHSKKQA